MSAFDVAWLALREGADARARDGALTARVQAHLEAAPGDPLRVVDLGAGSGSNLRFLGPRLPRRQSWTLVDADTTLLGAADAPVDCPPIEIRKRRVDLAPGVEDELLEVCDLVTASAFLDLVSEDWLVSLAQRCKASGVSLALFALTVDGSIAWKPADPSDPAAGALFREHMRSDKGFGPALGCDAAAAIPVAFGRAGYRTWSAPSPWRLGPTDAELQRRLLAGYVGAALELAPGRTSELQGWAARRLARIEAGDSELVVGHRDVLIAREPE